ncbi:MAG: hypothetical protein M0Z40_15145 [Actinomycetota bacterium]|nr:hypothetical protein [Actinomycetota bacterium]MDA8076537.1 hypothetical protein [Actinomycetota bacterium]
MTAETGAPPTRTTGSWRNRPPGVPGAVPPPSVPLAFLAAASAGLVACGVAWIWARSAAAVDPGADQVVAAVHFGVLATLAMGLLGATHQFTPVITGRPLRSLGLARATFVTWLAASWMLPIGIATEQLGVTAASGALAGVAIVLLVADLTAPLSARGKGAPVTALRFAGAGAVLTTFLGVAFVGDRQGHWFALPGHVDMAMGVIGMFGWLGITYVGVAEKLWPMFMLAHLPAGRRAGRVAVWTIPIGAAALAGGLGWSILGLAWAGAGVLAAGLGAHLASLWAHVQHRRRKTDLHLVFVMTSAAWLPVGAGLALAGALVLPHRYGLGVALVAAAMAAFGGWLLEALVGHAHKVVPFIVWSALRSRGVATGPSGKPLMFADLYDHRWAAVTYATTTAGVAALCVGLGASLPAATAVAGLLLVVTGIVAAANLSIRPVHLLRPVRLSEDAPVAPGAVDAPASRGLEP